MMPMKTGTGGGGSTHDSTDTEQQWEQVTASANGSASRESEYHLLQWVHLHGRGRLCNNSERPTARIFKPRAYKVPGQELCVKSTCLASDKLFMRYLLTRPKAVGWQGRDRQRPTPFCVDLDVVPRCIDRQFAACSKLGLSPRIDDLMA